MLASPPAMSREGFAVHCHLSRAASVSSVGIWGQRGIFVMNPLGNRGETFAFSPHRGGRLNHGSGQGHLAQPTLADLQVNCPGVMSVRLGIKVLG